MNLRELVSDARVQKGLWWQRAWSLIEGCTPVSEACEHCWAAAQCHMRSRQKNEKMRKRYAGPTTADGRWNGEIRWLQKNLELPKTVKKPTLFSIWNDLMHPDIQPLLVKLAIEVIRDCPQHFFLMLTKRPERALDHFCDNAMFMRQHTTTGKYVPDLPPNLGLGVTVELPKYLHRIETLLQIPAALHFVSLEPLLGELSLEPYLTGWSGKNSGLPHRLSEELETLPDIDKLDWVILGCESGRHRRDTDLEWFRKVHMECDAAKVPVFLKQYEFEGKVCKGIKRHPDNSYYLNFPEVEWSP